jgi:hypothetical protein
VANSDESDSPPQATKKMLAVRVKYRGSFVIDNSWLHSTGNGQLLFQHYPVRQAFIKAIKIGPNVSHHFSLFKLF